MKHPVKRAIVAALSSVVVAACGGGASTVQNSPPDSGSTPPPAGSVNQAPTISLPGESLVLIEREVVVVPTARDPEGKALTFTVENKPAWMQFSSTTGELRGTPAPVHVGTYSGIRITVSDGQAQASAETVVRVVASADGRATLTWSAPTERTDGSPLTNLAGFKIYFGSSAADLRYVIDVTDPGARSFVVEDLTQGTWYFAASAVDAAGLESARTNPVSKRI